MFTAAPLHLRDAGVSHPTVVLASLRTLDDKEQAASGCLGDPGATLLPAAGRSARCIVQIRGSEAAGSSREGGIAFRRVRRAKKTTTNKKKLPVTWS